MALWWKSSLTATSRPWPSRFPGPQHDRVLRLVLGHQQQPAARGGGPGGGGDGGEDVLGGGVDDGLGGVDPETVEVELADPVDGVGDEELPHRARLGVVEVERLPPVVVVTIGEVVRGEPVEDRAGRPEVVVDDVEDHSQSHGVGGVDEASHVVRAAVEVRRGEEVDPVVPPAERAGELRHRHDLDRPHPEIGQAGQPGLGGRPCALRSEGPDVELVDHVLVAGEAPPGVIGPFERGRIDDLGRAERADGLEARRRVGAHAPVLQPEVVQIAGRRPRDERREVPTWFGVEPDRLAPLDDEDVGHLAG